MRVPIAASGVAGEDARRNRKVCRRQNAHGKQRRRVRPGVRDARDLNAPHGNMSRRMISGEARILSETLSAAPLMHAVTDAGMDHAFLLS